MFVLVFVCGFVPLVYFTDDILGFFSSKTSLKTFDNNGGIVVRYPRSMGCSQVGKAPDFDSGIS